MYLVPNQIHQGFIGIQSRTAGAKVILKLAFTETRRIFRALSLIMYVLQTYIHKVYGFGELGYRIRGIMPDLHNTVATLKG